MSVSFTASPLASTGMCSRSRKTTSGMMDRPSKVQRSSTNDRPRPIGIAQSSRHRVSLVAIRLRFFW